MTTERNTALAIVPRTLGEIQTLADQLAKSNLLPEALRGKAADVLASIMTGQEIGLPPMAAIRGVHIVQGKPILAADTMVGIVLGSGLCEYFSQIEATNQLVTFETKRRGSPVPQRCSWSIDDAKRAGLYPTKDVWRAYPRAMLSARCRAELARSVYPDILAGIYDPDELGQHSTAPSSGMRPEVAASSPSTDIVDVEFVETKAPATTEQPTAEQPRSAAADSSLNEIAGALVASIYATTSLDDLAPLKVEADRLPKGTAARKSVVAAIKQQDAKLKLAQLAPVVDAANDAQPATEATAS